MENILRKPINPMVIKREDKLSKLLEGMSQAGFQGKNLGLALKIWQGMLKGKTTIFLGLAGALTPAGLRGTIVYLIENRLIDCIVSTGANLFHDLHECLGKYHYQGTIHIDDLCLKEEGIDRIYDVLAKEAEFRESEKFITEFAANLDMDKLYGTREFLFLLGKHLTKFSKQKGILTQAAKFGVPIYCPAIADSSLGIALFDTRVKKGKQIKIDVICDVLETGEIVKNSKQTGVIYLGGGVPKNFIQQAALVPAFQMGEDFSHKYAIQITADSPHWGGLSGCTLEEAISWGKISLTSQRVTIYSDVTLVFPILVKALAEKIKNLKRKIPHFSWEKFKIIYK